MMLNGVRFLLAVVIALGLVGTAWAQEPVLPKDSDPEWQAYYWNNTSLSGSAVLQRSELDLDHDWGSGSPHASVKADGFSARWTRYIYLNEGTYRFTATSDDGVRVWVDADLIINEWHDHAATTFSAEKRLGSGHHWVVVEYYENRGEAVAKLTWQPKDKPIQGWRGEYFNNTTLSGTPAVVRDDAKIDFDWGGESPAPGSIGSDRFSVRWTRILKLPAGRYRFAMTVDDGGRLWVNNHLLLASWKDQPATTYSQEIYLPGGDIPIKMEYYESGGKAVAKLFWEALTPTIQNWRGEYFSNTSLSGTPALVRDDSKIDFSWSDGSPAPGSVSADGFSVRWTRNVDMAAGRYRFSMTVDDGGRLWVNNHLLIDTWRDQAARTYSAEIDLPGGAVPIKMEYYENGGQAVARLTWSSAFDPISNWRGEYFNNTTLSGTPALVRDDASIDFGWGSASPAAGVIDADGFSARWTRALDLPAGRYRFSMTVDDGGRLWVNNQLLIDAWRDQSASTYSGVIDLPGGAVPVRMEYYEDAGLAVARLAWALDSTPTGTVIVDDTDAGFVQGGSISGWRTVSEGHGGHLTWTWNNDWERPNYNWARWTPSLLQGRYEVYAFIPDRYTTTSSARYLIANAGEYTWRVVSQSDNGGQWVSLGIYWFNGNGDEYVFLSDATGEAQRTTLIAFDAMKWIPR